MSVDLENHDIDQSSRAATAHAADAGAISGGITVDPDEVGFFAKIADTWWDPTGPFKPLHKLNPTRLAYIRQTVCEHFNRSPDQMRPLDGLRILDIGCGGGLVSEPLSRMGAVVIGVDASEKNVKAATAHADASGANVTYRHATAEDLADSGEQFDVVINMEVVEHVADVPAYLAACRRLIAPDGLMILSTINRTARALVFAKFMAEYVLGWLPKGAHDWRKFITPEELKTMARNAGLDPQAPSGFVYTPILDRWSISDRDVSMNYLLPVRPKGPTPAAC